MKNIKHYNLARLELESRFSGLAHAHMNLINIMITRADPSTGIVEGLSYRDLAILLTIDHAPGRKGAGIPQKQTIRSYLRTIEESCGKDFRLITQGQKLKCQFIHLPKIYAHFFGQKEEYTENSFHMNTPTSLENKEDEVVCEASFETVENVDCPTEDFQKITAKKILYLNKQNKQTGVSGKNSFFSKQPIAPDFYPSQDIITEALSRGFMSVTEPTEIASFIRHNQTQQTQWADFGPIYLQWLERGFEYQQRKLASAHLRSKHYGYTGIQSNRKSALEIVTEHNPGACSPSGEYLTRTFENEPDYEQSHGMVMDGIDEIIRTTLFEQERSARQRLMA